MAKRILSKTPFETDDAPRLPDLKELSGKINREIIVENSPNERVRPQVQTGAGERRDGGSINENLRKQRIYGNRLPVERTSSSEVKEDNGTAETRKTGAVKRLPPSEIRQEQNGNSETQEKAPDNFPIRSRGGKNRGGENRDSENNNSTPADNSRNKNTERRQMPPDAEPAQREERKEQQRQKPPEQEQPRSEQPQPRVEPRPEPPREKPPQQEIKPPREEKQPERRVDPPRKNKEVPVDKDN